MTRVITVSMAEYSGRSLHLSQDLRTTSQSAATTQGYPRVVARSDCFPAPLPLSRIVKIMKTSAIRLVVHLLVHDAHVVVIDVANGERSCLQHRSLASSV